MYDNLKSVEFEMLVDKKTTVLKHEVVFSKFEKVKGFLDTDTGEVFTIVGDEEIHFDRNEIIGFGKEFLNLL